MKQELSFWLSLENYTWKMLERVSPTLPYLGIIIIGMMMLSSLITHKASVAGTSSLREASVKAARVGDYTKAQALWNDNLTITNNQTVLGNMSEEEDLVFPERVVEREIQKYEAMLQEYSGHRDIYLALATLYAQINRSEEAQKYYGLARELDPNNVMIKPEI